MTKHVKSKWNFYSYFNIYSTCPFKERAKWGSSLEFILTVIGYAVGNLKINFFFHIKIFDLHRI